MGRLFSDEMCGGVLLSREASLAVPIVNYPIAWTI